MIEGTQNIKLLAFIAAFKNANTNGIINAKPNISAYASSIAVSHHTFKKYLNISKKHKFLTKRGLHLQFISLGAIINKLYPDKKINNKIRFFSELGGKKNNDKKCSMKQMEASIFESKFGKMLAAQSEQIFKKQALLYHIHHRSSIRVNVKKALLKQAILNGGKVYKKINRRNLKLNDNIVFGRNYISKAIGYSPSTCNRRIVGLIKQGKLRRKIVKVAMDNKFLLESEKGIKGVNAPIFYSNDKQQAMQVVGSRLLSCRLKGCTIEALNPIERFENSNIGAKAMLGKVFSERKQKINNLKKQQ